MDFSWALTLPREQISVLLAGRLAGAAVLALGVGSSTAGAMRHNVQAAGGYVAMHSRSPFFRVLLSVRGMSCQVTVTDRDFARSVSGGPDGLDHGDHAMERKRIAHLLSVLADQVDIHHNEHGGITLSFQIPLFQGQPAPGSES
ncbi:hypothetical protein ACFPFX_37805 [Streptomyces mauvecolor]|uniref:ATP-binding protein n=1 Tax=Streptomyces mauvecolor TaxID=58345 RepID=A0ABV9UXV9_9ACTN